MPLPRQILDEIAVRHRAAEILHARDRLRDWIISIVMCWTWAAAGLFLVGWSFHTSNMVYGRIAFWGGLSIGNGGIFYTLLTAWHRGEGGDQPGGQ